jgi:hypothetical protein
MRQPVNERFLEELERFVLCYTCDDCVHFSRHVDVCAHGWPNQDHRVTPQVGGDVVFCKEFELK